MPYAAIALSGGIDSLVAARILKEKGHDLLGIHFTTGYEQISTQQVRHISEQLEIPVKIIDCSADFNKLVVRYFINTYKSGKTPNPCLVCNPLIKFGIVLDFCRNLKADFLATGHYAQIYKDSNNRFHLLKAKDFKKDQSYFLAFMSQKQLASACFPLGGLTKNKVRKIAEQKGLEPSVKKESQDICFIKGSYKDFLFKHGNIKQKPGPIKDIKGSIIGTHNGLHLFTVGQRRGINCPGPQPYYVVSIDTPNNSLIVGFKDDLLTGQCRVEDINWINKPELLDAGKQMCVHVRLRYRHEPVKALVCPKDNNTVKLEFETPQSAVSPGQGAVFYNNDEVLGSGWICRE